MRNGIEYSPFGSGPTVNLAFPTPTFTYGTDDTSALQALETFMETDYDRGVFNAAEVPGDHTCLLQTLEIQRPVTWRSSGSRQAQLMQVMGAGGSTVDGARYGFVVVAANFPSFDQYQDTTVGEAEVALNNLSIIGGTQTSPVAVNGTSTAYSNDGLLFQNPAGAYVLFDGAQFQGSRQENMYLDQQNETLICAANCVFLGAMNLRFVSPDRDMDSPPPE